MLQGEEVEGMDGNKDTVAHRGDSHYGSRDDVSTSGNALRWLALGMTEA